MATKMKETIKAATIARYTDKSGKLLGFGVKSNHSDEQYCVKFVRVNGIVQYTCDCYAGQHDFAGCKDGKCAHVKAVIEVAKARAELSKENELKQEQQSAVAAAEQHLASELDAKREEQLATAEQVAPMVLGDQFNSDLGAHIDDELSVPVFLDHDGHYGRVRVDGKVEELSVSEIRERFPRFKVVSGEEFYESEQQAAWAVLSKERQRQLYSELYPDDYGYVA